MLEMITIGLVSIFALAIIIVCGALHIAETKMQEEDARRRGEWFDKMYGAKRP